MSWEHPTVDFPPNERLHHMSEYVWAIRYYLMELSAEERASGRLCDWGCLCHLEDLSDEAQHIPIDWKLQANPSLDWERWNRLAGDLRDKSRYPTPEELWKLATVELDLLDVAIDAMLVALGYSAGGGTPSPQFR